MTDATSVRCELYPAIDLRAGRVVRLRKGDYDAETVYGDDPVAVASAFADAGAPWVHVVDLDAARSGDPVNRPIITRIAEALAGRAQLQTGGGVRAETDAEALAAAGVSRVVMGSAAIADPELYEITASYSGCARTSDPLGQAYIRTVVEDRGRGDVTNMWGPLDGPGWKANDPYLNAAKLRGTKVYLTTGTGFPGEFDTLAARLINGDPQILADQIMIGGAIEATVYSCTQQMREALDRANVDTTVLTRPTGTHSWAYWESDLHRTWPSIAKDLARD